MNTRRFYRFLAKMTYNVDQTFLWFIEMAIDHFAKWSDLLDHWSMSSFGFDLFFKSNMLKYSLNILLRF